MEEVKAKTKTLFSVTETIDAKGQKYISIDWHPELYPALDEIAPNGEVADRIIDIAEELLHAFDDDEERP